MWTPNMSEPVVKMLCHSGPVRALAFDVEGRYMVTTGLDSRMKVGDCVDGVVLPWVGLFCGSCKRGDVAICDANFAVT